MLTLKEKEQRLFERWRTEEGYPSFISDGVFNETLWEQQSPKITFIMKEANWENGDVDLCEWLLGEPKGSYWKTWNNIARWSQALLSGGGYPRHVSKSDKTYWLSKVSFVNLKKVGGGRQADNDVLRGYALKDAPYLREQLSLYAPDIMICCGWWVVADILYQNVLPKDTLSAWQETGNGFDYFYTRFEGKEGPVPVVSFYHPQRIASHAVFEGWYHAMREIGDTLLPGESVS